MVERFVNWLFKKAGGNWVTIVLIGILMSVLIYGFQRANWVRDDAVLSTAFTLGVIFGWLLARSRFHGVFAALYVLMIAVVVAVEGIGRILPSPVEFFINPPAEVIEQMNLRIVSASLRINGWIETLRAGANVQDPSLFVGLFSVVLTLCGAWMIWNIQRKRNVLLGLLPVGILFAVNVHLGRQPLINYMIFLFISLLLIARTEYNFQHEEWDRRRVDYPEQLGLEWAGAALAFALVIALVSRAAPFLGTPEGWQAVSSWVNRANQQTEETATRLFSGVNPPPPVQGEPAPVSVNIPELGEIGAPLPQGLSTIMWVSVSDPPPLPANAGIYAGQQASRRVHYWRSDIFQEYTGRGWRPASLTEPLEVPLTETVPPAPAGRYLLRQVFEIVARNNGSLFSVNDPLQSVAGVKSGATIPDGSRLLKGDLVTYEVVSSATQVSASQLASASTTYPPEISAAYLQLPASVPGRVTSLANRIVVGSQNPYQKAIRIQNYLRENFEYDLNIGEAPPQRDVVDYFLFDVQAGFCSHYATAMVVMLRSVGVPARVAAGYAMGEFESDYQAYRVPESASHAWVEAYFSEYGWVEFEPTVARRAIEYDEEGVPLAQDQGAAAAVEDQQPGPLQPLFIALVFGAMLLLLGLPILLLRMFAILRQPSNIPVDALYRRIRRALGWAGLSAVGSVTPDEYLALYSSRLEPYETMHKALRQTTALYRESIFSPRPPAPHRVRSASILWQRSLKEWIDLWLRVNWSKLRSRITILTRRIGG